MLVAAQLAITWGTGGLFVSPSGLDESATERLLQPDHSSAMQPGQAWDAEEALPEVPFDKEVSRTLI